MKSDFRLLAQYTAVGLLLVRERLAKNHGEPDGLKEWHEFWIAAAGGRTRPDAAAEYGFDLERLHDELRDAQFLTTAEAGLVLRRSARTIRRRCAAGEIAGARRDGGDWRIPRNSLLEEAA